MTSYQKLKKKNEELIQDIYKILDEDIYTIARYSMRKAICKNIWFGSSLKDGEGITPQIVRPHRVDLITKKPT